MKPARIVHPLSHVPLHIGTSCNGVEMSIGTAFCYTHQSKQYLITNWHNVSGRSPSTFGPLFSTTAALPDSLILRIPYKALTEDGLEARQWKPVVLRLYKDEANITPIWFEHPSHGPEVDAVVIPLEGIEKTEVVASNDQKLDLSKLELAPGLDVFILGYPRGLSGGGRFPIWKRGSIASEPDVDIDGLPKFYVDTATREGMSGAPVYAEQRGFWAPEGGKLPDDGVFGTGQRFVGIYSGRINADDPFLAQLGVVWKERAIIEIIEGTKVGRSSFSY